MLIVIVFVFKSISDLNRVLGKLDEKDVGFDDGKFEDEGRHGLSLATQRL
jgi:hypothetical protein